MGRRRARSSRARRSPLHPRRRSPRARRMGDADAGRAIRLSHRRQMTQERLKSGNGEGGGNGWGEYLVGVASGDHDAMVRFALALINSGMADAAAENFLYDAVTAYAANIDPERLKRRLREIPDLVSSARKILDAEEKEEQGQAGPQQAPAQPQATAAGPLPELGEWDIAGAPPSPPRGWLLGHVFCRTYISE